VIHTREPTIQYGRPAKIKRSKYVTLLLLSAVSKFNNTLGIPGLLVQVYAATVLSPLQTLAGSLRYLDSSTVWVFDVPFAGAVLQPTSSNPLPPTVTGGWVHELVTMMKITTTCQTTAARTQHELDLYVAAPAIARDQCPLHW